MSILGTMRGTKLVAIGIAAIVGCFVAFGTQPGGIVGMYRETLSPMMFAVWLVGFVTATVAPPAVAIAFWLGSKPFRYSWALHILLVPTTFVFVRGCIALMLFAADEPDSDGLTGWATDPAVLLMVICPIVYFIALGVRYAGRFHRQANGS